MTEEKIDFSVMVVDDESDMRYTIARILRKCSCGVVEAESVQQAMDLMAQEHYDIVFSDMRFNGEMGGEDLLEFAIEHHPATEIVLISCAMDDDRKASLMQRGASFCIQKPFFKDTCLELLAMFSDKNNQKVA